MPIKKQDQILRAAGLHPSQRATSPAVVSLLAFRGGVLAAGAVLRRDFRNGLRATSKPLRDFRVNFKVATIHMAESFRPLAEAINNMGPGQISPLSPPARKNN